MVKNTIAGIITIVHGCTIVMIPAIVFFNRILFGYFYIPEKTHGIIMIFKHAIRIALYTYILSIFYSWSEKTLQIQISGLLVLILAHHIFTQLNCSSPFIFISVTNFSEANFVTGMDRLFE